MFVRLFTGEQFMMLTITDSIRNNVTYEGTTRKFGVTIDNKNYMVKFAKDNDLSVLCEYIASSFINKLGYSCQTVYLGQYKGEYVDVVYDFASNNDCYLHSFKDTKQSSVDTDIGDKEYTYSDIIYLIDKHLKLSDRNKLKTKQQFWQMYICDAILGNRDRHWGNWGYLGKDNQTNYVPAPIYDNGASLFPGVNFALSAMMQDRKKFFRDRVFEFPASLFKVQRPDRAYRSNYYDIFSDLRINRIFAEEVRKIKQRISYKDLFAIIVGIVNTIEVPIDKSIKQFWVEIVTLRYMCIILRMNFDKAYTEVERMLGRI